MHQIYLGINQLYSNRLRVQFILQLYRTFKKIIHLVKLSLKILSTASKSNKYNLGVLTPGGHIQPGPPEWKLTIAFDILILLGKATFVEEAKSLELFFIYLFQALVWPMWSFPSRLANLANSENNHCDVWALFSVFKTVTNEKQGG